MNSLNLCLKLYNLNAKFKKSCEVKTLLNMIGMNDFRVDSMAKRQHVVNRACIKNCRFYTLRLSIRRKAFQVFL